MPKSKRYWADRFITEAANVNTEVRGGPAAHTEFAVRVDFMMAVVEQLTRIADEFERRSGAKETK